MLTQILIISMLLVATNAEESVGEVCQTHTNNSIPDFCGTCLDRFEELGYNPWIKTPYKSGLLINHKFQSLVNNSCEIYNPAATCEPNRNMDGMTFQMGGDDDAYIYVNISTNTQYNFIGTTVYIQCEYHDPPFCFVVTFVDECPPVGLTMAAKVSISIVAIFIALVVITVIILLTLFCIIRQLKRLPGREEKKLLKYTQMT